MRYAADAARPSTRSARLGGILAPQALTLGENQMSLGFGCLALASAAVTLMLPETLGRAMR
eukprot:SAG11_NODE_1318_length_5212_cov_3.462351_5_plen_61_part_00